MNLANKPSVTVTSLLSGAVVAATLLFTAVPRIYADDRSERCQRRIAHAEHELHEAREHCWSEYHQWWDEHEHRWRTERDWDEHDHDRD